MVDLSTDSSGRPVQIKRLPPNKTRRFGSGDFQKTGDVSAVFETIFLLVATAACAFVLYWAVTIYLTEKVN